MVFVLVGKDFLGQVIKVEFAEKRVPKGGFGRGGGGRGAVVFQLLHWIKYYATWHILILMLYSLVGLEWPDLANCFVVAVNIIGENCGGGGGLGENSVNNDEQINQKQN